jgi:tetratricopeptide (TPR) repeat protein
MRMRFFAAIACTLALASPLAAQSTAGRTGWDAIRAGKNEQAAAAFADALRAEPRDPSLYLGAGLAAQLLGDTAKARESLEQALRLAPDYTPASLLLGDLLYRQSDLQGAIAVYEAAIKYAADDNTLRARLTQLREEPSPERGFFQSQSAHFMVLFKDLPTRSSRVAPLTCWSRRTGMSARRSTRFRITSLRSCSTPKSSSATRRDHRRGRPRPTMAASAFRCAARSNRRPASWNASSRTS